MVNVNMKMSDEGFQNNELKKAKAPRVIIKLTEHSRLKKSNTKPSTPKSSSSLSEEPIKSTPKSSLPAEDNIIATAKISTILRKLRLSQSSCEEENDEGSKCVIKQTYQYDNGFQSFKNQKADEDSNLQQKNYGQSRMCQPHQSRVKNGSNSIYIERKQVVQDNFKDCKLNNKSTLSPTVSKTSTIYTESNQDSKCSNCKSPEHNYLKCPEPQKVKCYRCGWGYVTQENCPFCTGTLVRPGSTVRVPVGGDLKKKYPGVPL
ncbi:uncharacterized protein LOC106657999 [Trichogramma pretiosum]|uniref:uncharacterized protein LOC106657999 n=1 Tax=Trichogramma pretiosum TaxID=7493 RepID=UPI0006C98364|nr:uncharacterized protein LOC106657999 [Trichogramma pretiosum]